MNRERARGLAEAIDLLDAQSGMLETFDDGTDFALIDCKKGIDKALALLLSLTEQWRTIDSAPPGTMVLFGDMGAAEAEDWFFVGWRVGAKIYTGPNQAGKATHWMPLPAAPSVGQDGEMK